MKQIPKLLKITVIGTIGFIIAVSLYEIHQKIIDPIGSIIILII
jgi:hypothetical protein